jgi:hypothetical protein
VLNPTPQAFRMNLEENPQKPMHASLNRRHTETLSRDETALNYKVSGSLLARMGGSFLASAEVP